MVRHVAASTASHHPAERVFNGSRQVWLAGLGLFAVSRNWARNEANRVFETLVGEGAVVEKRAVKVISSQYQNSVANAGMLWNTARREVLTKVGQLKETTAEMLPRFRQTGVAKSAAKRAPARAKATKRVTRRPR